jgi:REP element-mobilizing transposase RayT
MARQNRDEVAPGTINAWARGVERRLIFLDDEDRQLYLRLLIGVARRLRWRVLSYCLMGNHVHLLVETTEPNFGRGMQLLHGRYAQIFNLKYGRVGHLFQERYGSRLVHDELDLAVVVGYIAANPVAASLCERPEDYEWSSYAATVRDEGHPIVDIPHLKQRLAPLGLSFEEVVRARLLSRGLLATV